MEDDDDSNDETDLIRTIQSGNANDVQDLLQRLLRKRGHIEKLVNNSLFYAASNASLECVKLLLNYVTNVNVQNSRGDTALMIACRQGDKSTARLLLQHRSHLCVRNVNGHTAMDLAGIEGKIDLIKVLAEESLKLPTSHDVRQNAAFVLYAGLTMTAMHAHFDAMRMLVDMGVDVNLNLDPDIGTALHAAVDGGSLACVRYLLEKGANISSLRHCVKQTPLMRCAEIGRYEIAKILLETGADVNCQTEGCSTPLQLACHYGHAQLVDLFLAYGASAHVCNVWGFTPLYMATDSPDILRRILQEGVDVNQGCGDRQEVALHLASVVGCMDAVEQLIDSGASVNIQTVFNETPLWLAAWKGHINVSRALIGQNCEMGVASNGCETYVVTYLPFEVALGEGQFELAQLLYRAGCSTTNPAQPPIADAHIPLRVRPEVLHYLRGNQVMWEWFCFTTSNPRSLKDLTRFRVRQLLGTPFMPKLIQLNLPHLLRDIVMLKDIL